MDVPTIPLALAQPGGGSLPLQLRFTQMAYYELEQLTGSTLGLLLQSTAVSKYVPLLWAACRHAPPQRPWTLDAAAGLLDAHYTAGGGRDALEDAVIEAVYASGVAKRPDPANPPAAEPTAPTAPASRSTSAPTSPSPAG